LKLSKLPLVRNNDFGAGKGIGYHFIPFYNYYWNFRFVNAMNDRLNFQLRLRGDRKRSPTGLGIACNVLWVIPLYGFVVTWIVLMPIMSARTCSRRRTGSSTCGSTKPRLRPALLGRVEPKLDATNRRVKEFRRKSSSAGSTRPPWAKNGEPSLLSWSPPSRSEVCAGARADTISVEVVCADSPDTQRDRQP